MSRGLVDLPVQPGWIPSWDADCYHPDELADPAGELLGPEVTDTPQVRAWVAAVAAEPADPEAVAGRCGGFSSWTESLPGRPDLDLVTGLAEAERAARIAAARQVAFVQEFCSRRPGTGWVGGRAGGSTAEFTADHLALALGVSVRSATNRIHEAQALLDYPRILAALGAGLVSMAGVGAFLREVAGLDLAGHPDHSTAVETRVLGRVGEPFLPDLGTWTPGAIAELPFGDVAALMCAATPGQISVWTRRAVVLADGDAARSRTVKAAEASRVETVTGAGFGMGWLGAWLPEDQVAAAYERIDLEAHHRLNHRHPSPHPDLETGKCGGDAQGSLDATRAQVFYDLLMNTPTALPGEDSATPPVPVHLTVLVDAEGVATTPGLGPIHPATLQALDSLATRTGGSTRAVLQQPVTCPGEHPNGGRDDPYLVPAAMRRHIQLRDRTCRYPGCTRPAMVCDLDHTIPWPLGPTCPCNLSCLCRHHHRLKTHEPGWSVTNRGHGSLIWRTPYGTFHTRP